jgi:hypothetical protein
MAEFACIREFAGSLAAGKTAVERTAVGASQRHL